MSIAILPYWWDGVTNEVIFDSNCIAAEFGACLETSRVAAVSGNSRELVFKLHGKQKGLDG
jgi:hypothetical protein